jgi:hypothetical protein
MEEVLSKEESAMRITVLRGTIALALVVSLAATAAFAQPLPVENHYKVYNNPPIPISKLVGLRDQFGGFSVDVLTFERFATPATKILPDGTVYPMINGEIHMDWWRIAYPQPARTIIVTDQFGKAPWVVGDARYLLVPSLKNVPPPAVVPPWNHYLCYDALTGPLVGTLVTLVDQFGNVNVRVLQAKYFCNPVEKRADGQLYPIIDPNAHLACYQVDNPFPEYHPITTVDQFGYWQTQIDHNDCLCVPALKDYPLATEQSTWGRIKALYRN